MKSEQICRTIKEHYTNEIKKLRENLRTAADVMADFSDRPQDIAFQHAAKMYKSYKAQLEEAESVSLALANGAEQPRIIVAVRGGLVEAVYCDRRASVDVVDFDICAGGDDFDPNYDASVSSLIEEINNGLDNDELRNFW